MTARPGTSTTRSVAELFGLPGAGAIVTGGFSGIGLACAELLADAGARVLAIGLGETPEQRAGPGVGGVEFLRCDVTDAAATAHAVEHALARFGRLDVVVCAAGAALDAGTAARGGGDSIAQVAAGDAEDDLARLDAMFDLHVRSVARLADLALPALAERGGAFTIVSSIAGLRGNRLLRGYGVTKAANAQLARNLAVGWGGAGVRVNAVSPGVVATAFAEPITADEPVARARLARTPLGRFGRADEVAATVLWLSSPAGAFVTGQNIVVDGGTLIAD